MVTIVKLTKKAERNLSNCPTYISSKFKYWVGLVESFGIDVARTIKGFHDEPLKGRRIGQRSIRLNKSYRAIYAIRHDGCLDVIEVQEVHKHEY